jgi:very-short-patch-repair endonuclease
MTKLFNKAEMKFYRRTLRKNMTEHERLLWKHLRKRQLAGYRFLRQYSVDRYILDFYCPEKKLGIELDGSQHAEEKIIQYDQVRTTFLESYGIRIIRFWNSEVRYNIGNVLETICNNLELSN